MGKKLVSRTAKVLSETKKSRGKEAIAIAYEHIPRDPEEQKHGALYAVIELEDSGGHAEEIAEKIIDILHNEYYEDTAKTPLNSFENALAKINEELAERSSEGQINWLGKLNAVLGVLAENTLHLTQSGKAEAYLYRAEHALHITEDLAGDSINPLRTFINVASGDLTEKDKIILVTPGVFYKLSKHELKKYATENSPKIAAENLSQLLSGENGNTLPNAVLLMEMISPESFAVEPEPEKSTEAWVKEERNIMEPVAKEAITGTAKAFEVIGKAASGATTFISSKAFPAIKSSAKKVSAGFRKEEEAPEIILSSEETLTGSNLEPERDSILETSREELTEIRIKESKPKFLNVERFDFSFAKTFKNNISRNFKRTAIFSPLYLMIAAGLIVLVVGYSFYAGTIKKDKAEAKNNYNQAKIAYEKALEESATGQRTTALENLQIAENLATGVKNGKYQKEDAEKLLAQIISAKDQVSGIVKNTANVFADLGADFEGIYTDGKLIYALDYETGNVSSVDLNSAAVNSVITNAGIDSNIKFATFIPKRKVIFGFTQNNEAYEFDLTAKKATKQKISGTWEDSVAADTYNSNLYLLSPATSQIYKHIKTSSGYGKGTKYFNTTANISGALDVAIDSDVYVLINGGNVQKYTAGAVQEYAIKNLPAPITDAKDIYAAVDVEGQYIATSNLITKIDKSQNFVATYKSDAIKNIKSFYADDVAKKLYVISEGKIYTIAY